MAKQEGILPIQGTLGNLTFYKSKDGYRVKTKSGVSADKIATDDAFQRTRENNAEFGRAGKASKLLRTSLRITIAKAKDNRLVSRLTARMLKVVQADEVSDRGLRNVIDGEASLVEGFDFNIGAKLSATVYMPYAATFDRASGKASITVSDFIPQGGIAAPAGTTHFRLFMGIASVDFEKEAYESSTATTEALPYGNTSTGEVTLSANIAANSTHPVFMAFGVEFLQEVNKKMYSLHNGAFNACVIAKVSTPE